MDSERDKTDRETGEIVGQKDAPPPDRVSKPKTIVQDIHVNAIEMALKAGMEILALPRIGWPSNPRRGTHPTWTLDALEADEPEEVEHFDGVALALLRGRVYYDQPYGGGGNLPACTSVDRHTGMGKPGGNCEACSLATSGCRQVTWLIVLRESMYLPTLIQVPPTSINELDRYETAVMSHWGKRLFQVGTRFGLAPYTTTTGRTVSRIALRAKSRESGLNIDTGSKIEISLIEKLRKELSVPVSTRSE